jgi:hypothetical protein
MWVKSLLTCDWGEITISWILQESNLGHGDERHMHCATNIPWSFLCMTYSEIFQVLQDQHEQFRESLQQAEEDMRTLRRLDKQIKSYHVSINPYVPNLKIFYFIFTFQNWILGRRNLSLNSRVYFKCCQNLNILVTPGSQWRPWRKLGRVWKRLFK